MQPFNDDPDRVRANTRPETLEKIDAAIDEKILYYSAQPREAVSARIRELEREWDMERILETNASSLALSGVFLGVVRSRKYLVLSAAVLSFLLLHAVKGWCPPVPLLRKMGVRTRSEIDREKFALKLIRGDFENLREPGRFKEQPASEVLSAVKQS